MEGDDSGNQGGGLAAVTVDQVHATNDDVIQTGLQVAIIAPEGFLDFPAMGTCHLGHFMPFSVFGFPFSVKR